MINEFAKIFTVDGYQILFHKGTNSEGGLIVKCVFYENEMEMCVTLDFEAKAEKRDEYFNNVTQDIATKFLASVLNMLQEGDE